MGAAAEQHAGDEDDAGGAEKQTIRHRKSAFL
jgi:hypothetical protein